MERLLKEDIFGSSQKEQFYHGQDNCTERPEIAIGYSLDHFKKALRERKSIHPCVICIDGYYVENDSGNIKVGLAPLDKIEIIEPFKKESFDRFVGFVKNKPHSKLKNYIQARYGGEVEYYLHEFSLFYKIFKKEFNNMNQ